MRLLTLAMLALAPLLRPEPVAAVAAAPSAAGGASPGPAAGLSDLEERLRRAQELINQLELQSEQVQSQIDRQRPMPIAFGDGRVSLDFAAYFPGFGSSTGQTAHLGFNLRPHAQVRGYLEIEAIGSVAVDRLLPQWEFSMDATNSRFIVKRAEAVFENDWLLARAFRMMVRPDLYEEGDFYSLLPAADDIEKYFRQTGRGVPNGFQILMKEGWLKGLEAWAGDELTYGGETQVFGRYRRRLGRLDFALMAQGIHDPSLVSGKSSEGNYEAWLGIPLGDSTRWDVVAVAKPTRAGQSYEVVEKTAPGAGTGGTEYLKKSVVTAASDAYGLQTRVKSRLLPLLEEESLHYEYSLPLAGNKQRLSGLFSLRPQRSLLISAEAAWQQPLVGPMPLIYFGTPGFSAGQLSGPRPFGSVVSVSEDPISRVNNREMTELALTVDFNPGQGWFYKYRPRIVEAWNFNEALVSPFSSALSLRLWSYPSGTDLGSYISGAGLRTPEAPGAGGLLPSRGTLSEIKWITQLSTGPLKWVLDAATGDSFMGLSPVYGSPTVKPETRYLRGDLSMTWRDTTLSGGYAEDVWGPDDWWRTFGLAIPLRFKAGLVQRFGRSEFSLRYEGWRDKDPSKYRLPMIAYTAGASTFNVEAPVDQVFSTYTIRF